MQLERPDEFVLDPTETPEPTLLTLERTIGPAVVCRGYLMRRVCGDPGGTKGGQRLYVLSLYRVLSIEGDEYTAGVDGYAVTIAYRSTFVADSSKDHVYLGATAEDIWREMAGHDPCGDVTVRPGSCSDKRLQQIQRTTLNRFRATAHRLIAAFPELADRTLDLAWRCDVCGGSVTSRNGWLEWRARDGEGKLAYGLRLVHASNPQQEDGCTDQDADGDCIADGDRLVEFLGQDGLMRLLGLMSDGMCPAEEVIEMTKRLHVARYEAARFYFEHAKRDGYDTDLNMPYGCYSQSMLSDIIARYSPKGEVVAMRRGPVSEDD